MINLKQLRTYEEWFELAMGVRLFEYTNDIKNIEKIRNNIDNISLDQIKRMKLYDPYGYLSFNNV